MYISTHKHKHAATQTERQMNIDKRRHRQTGRRTGTRTHTHKHTCHALISFPSHFFSSINFPTRPFHTCPFLIKRQRRRSWEDRDKRFEKRGERGQDEERGVERKKTVTGQVEERGREREDESEGKWGREEGA